MAVSLPKYGLTVPSETSRFRDLGKELREMGLAIEDILESFDYTGADPNLVLSRVSALEAWRADISPRVAALETIAEIGSGAITATTGHTFGSETKLRRTGDGYVTGYLKITRTVDFSSGASMGYLPVGWRPDGTREFVAFVSQGGTSTPVLMQILGDGVMRVWSGATSWAGNRAATANVSFQAA